MKTAPKKSDFGKVIACKFCRKQVWFEQFGCRIFEVDSDELHVNSCERRKAFYKKMNSDAAQSRREAKA